MPTGYTASIYEGENPSFEQFVMTCARNFGALIEMRDEPLDAEIPDEFKPGAYYAARVRELSQEINKVQAMSLKEVSEFLDREFERWVEAKKKREREAAELQRRYQAMLDQVISWKSPTKDHDGLKEFMIQQLQESIKFDCSTRHIAGLFEPPHADPETWRDNKLETLNNDLKRAEKDLQDAEQRAKERTRWVQQLKRSLKEYSDA